jgi:hypothetical protein
MFYVIHSSAGSYVTPIPLVERTLPDPRAGPRTSGDPPRGGRAETGQAGERVGVRGAG